MLGIARAVISEIYNLASGRLLASLGLAGAVCCGVVFGWTDYGDGDHRGNAGAGLEGP